MRLQKFLSAAGVCSRREGETYILQGRVSINDTVITELGTQVDPEMDRIAVDGIPATIRQNLIYIALNKPRGYVTSCRQGEEKIVLDLIDIPERIYPVGRLDKDSSGLLLLTNDGRIHHRLSHPSFDHEKEYEVTVTQPVSTGALLKMEKGILLMGRKTRPSATKRLAETRFRIILMEGRNRQIRRMVQKIGNKVSRLHRIRISNIKIDRLPSGSWRHLRKAEIKELLRLSGLSDNL
jgi:23S rRNA pseudouridine2605 synthase